MPFGCFASLHRLSYYLQFTFPTFGQLLCPSSSLVHYFLSSLHYTTFVPRLLLSWHGILAYAHCCYSMHTPFSNHRYNTHWVSLRSLRHSFTSAGFSPPAANNFACLSCLLRLRVCHGFCARNTIPTLKTKTHAKPLRVTLLSTARLTPFFVSSTLQAHARSVHSFVIPVSLVRHAPFATVWTSLPHSHASF